MSRVGALTLALALCCCAPVLPTYRIFPSGLLVVSTDSSAPLGYVEEMARCVAQRWEVPAAYLSGLTIHVSRGYAVTCSDGELRRACYEPREHKIKIADEPLRIQGDIVLGFPDALYHELTHWALHVLGRRFDDGAPEFYRPESCY